MRRNAIARIIVYSVLTVLLISILVVGLGFRAFSFIHDSRTENTQNHENIVGRSIPAGDIQEIEINWVSGSVSVAAKNEDCIRMEETEVSDAKYAMRTYVEGHRLIIDFCEDSKKLANFNLGSKKMPDKDLYITIPAQWDGKLLMVDAVSADVDVKGINCDTLQLNTVSGENTFINCTAQHVEMDTVSGCIRYEGQLEKLECNGVSADCNITVLNNPRSIEMDTVSGVLNLTLPEDCGFTLEKDTLSGSLHCEFPVDKKGDQVICGNGSCRIDVSGISGNVNIFSHSLHHESDAHSVDATLATEHHTEEKHH